MGIYNPENDNNHFKKVKYSVGKEERFYQSPSEVRAKSVIPNAYLSNNLPEGSPYKKIHIGYG